MTVATNNYARRGGLLVPSDVLPAGSETSDATAIESTSAQVDRRPDASKTARGKARSAEEVREQLAADRALIDVRSQDERDRRRQQMQHRMALADVANEEKEIRRQRRDQVEEARESAELARYYRRAAGRGTRARIRADIARSAEMRTLRVARVRTAALAVGISALTAFGAWSTAGVQAGVARLLNLSDGSAGWWAAWAVEPALLAVVALIIVSRAVLESSGGQVDKRADRVEWTALTVSILLNLAGGWKAALSIAAVGGLIAHSIGPVGAAGVAYLISVLLEYVAKARPWQGAPRLADLDLTIPQPGRLTAGGVQASSEAPPEAINLGKLPTSPFSAEVRPEVSGGSSELSETDRELLYDVLTAIESRLLEPDPSGWQIYQRVMRGRGDKGRAYRVANAARGWRQGQPVPGGAVNGHRVDGLAVTR